MDTGHGHEFGSEIAPSGIDDQYTQFTFDVQAGGIYVLEVHIPGGGFF